MDPSNTVVRAKSLKNRSKSFKNTKNPPRKEIPRSRHDSIGALEDILQCGICLEKLKAPRMLPCQHTFCLECLQSHLMVKNVINSNQSEGDFNSIKCPICQFKVNLAEGDDEAIKNLPKNLYLDSLLKVVDGEIGDNLQKPPDYRCVKCQTISEQQEQICQHCLQIFCNICWNEHLSELESNLSTLIKQVDESKNRLDHKLDNFENRCDQLSEKVREATEKKIADIKSQQNRVLSDIQSIKTEGKVAYDNINESIDRLKSKLGSNTTLGASNFNKVTTFLGLHRSASKLLRQVNQYGEARVIFDSDNFKLDQDTEGIYDAIENEIVPKLENVDSNTQYYKNKSPTPKLIWNKCPRPAHVAIPPWNDQLLYICATDTRSVLILNRTKFKLEGRLTHESMLHPLGVAFSKKFAEIYITDKWQHCVHVFTQSGDYSRQLFSKGKGDNQVRNPDGLAYNAQSDQLIISDSGNDRILIVDPQSGSFLRIIGPLDSKNRKSELDMPQGVATFEDSVIVADTGNHRIVVYSLQGEKRHEFGYLGRRKGQFRSAEVVAVDPLGFILVGDGGNARIQIFSPDGTVVKIFGGEGFGWLSGICISNQMDIITTNSKSRTLRIF